MSFSSDVKNELVNIDIKSRHCAIAELSAIIPICLRYDNDICFLQTENSFVAKRLERLLRVTFSFNIESTVYKKENTAYKKQYNFFTENAEDMQKLLLSTGSGSKSFSSLIVSSVCCKRAYVRGAFIVSGSLSNPEKSYHAEFLTPYPRYAESILTILDGFKLKPKSLIRGGKYITYLKDSEQISNLLNIAEAHEALMELENIRILKEMLNDINRVVNFTTANLDKTVSASAKQVLDIECIVKARGMSYLPKPLQDIARLRLLNNHATLKEIGQMLNPEVSKSGVNHRFKKISEIAETLRGGFN